MSMGSRKVSVLCRVRPAKPHERSDVVEIVDDRSVRLIAPDARATKGIQTNVFSFSRVLGPDSTQEDMYEAVQEVVSKSDEAAELPAQSVVLFAFGVSGSGKTHTMQGTGSDPGLIPRIVNRSYAVGHGVQAISYYELYQDKVYDLLSVTPGARHPPALDIREAPDGKVFVANLSQEAIADQVEFEQIYLAAGARRHVSATNLNQASSRSHAILELHLSNGGRITLCDLAGSENNKRTGNEHSKERMRESSDINLSLHTLQSCVKALNKGDTRIPYRNSKLTRILSDALGGHSVGMLITCIAPEAGFYNDTKNSLAFASLSRNVESRPSVVPELPLRPVLRARTTNFAAAALATITEKARSSLPIPLSPRSQRPVRTLSTAASKVVAPAGMTAEQLEAHIQRRVSELWHAKIKAEGSSGRSPRKRPRESPGPETETKRLKQENEELWKRLERLERMVAPQPTSHSAAGDLAGESSFETSFSYTAAPSSESDVTMMPTRAFGPLPLIAGSAVSTAASTMGRLPLKVARNPLAALGLSPTRSLPAPGRNG